MIENVHQRYYTWKDVAIHLLDTIDKLNEMIDAINELEQKEAQHEHAPMEMIEF